jgi:two-component system, NtrC family, sensor histidine kinase HydH
VRDRLIQREDDGRVYEIAKRFTPMVATSPQVTQPRIGSDHNPLTPHDHTGDTIVLGMAMAWMDAARRADLNHAIMMAGIVLALGTGTFFFLFVIQNYYLVGRALQQNQNYTQQVITSMSDGMLSIDTQGSVVAINKASVDILGIEPDRLKGIDLREILDFESSGVNDSLTRGHAMREREIAYARGTGTSIPLGITTSPILEQDGSSQGAVLILRDLREIKLLEAKVRRSEKLAAVGKLAAGIAHEVRNPLGSIRGFAQFLRHSLTDMPKEHEYAQIMVDEIDRINRVVTDLLSFANPRDAELETTDASELIRNIVKLVEMDIQAKQIDMQVEISPDLGDMVVDAAQITQAFLNLLINALKFVPAEGRIKVTAERTADRSGHLFQIEDNGPGIKPDQMSKIFEPFYTTRDTGTGLGLAIVHKIVENHQGEIDVISPLPGRDHGTVFAIQLPITQNI